LLEGRHRGNVIWLFIKVNTLNVSNQNFRITLSNFKSNFVNNVNVIMSISKAGKKRSGVLDDI
jgi:hypothetical protein